MDFDSSLSVVAAIAAGILHIEGPCSRRDYTISVFIISIYRSLHSQSQRLKKSPIFRTEQCVNVIKLSFLLGCLQLYFFLPCRVSHSSRYAGSCTSPLLPQTRGNSLLLPLPLHLTCASKPLCLTPLNPRPKRATLRPEGMQTAGVTLE